MRLNDFLQKNKQLVIYVAFLLVVIVLNSNTAGNVFGAGYAPVSSYEARLTAYALSTDSTINVNSTKDQAGREIVLTEISSSTTVPVFLTLEPGTIREEIIQCTGKSTNVWSSCTRGLDFQGGSRTASTTLAFAHNAGAKIIISNVGQFYGEFVSITGDQTMYGVKTFDSFPAVSSTTALVTTNGQFATKYYVDNVGAGGFTAANVSSTYGLQALGTAPETVGINVSSTASLNGGFLNLTGDKIYWNLPLLLAGSWTWAGTNTFATLTGTSLTATSTVDNLQITGTPDSANDVVNYSFISSTFLAKEFGDGSDGALDIQSGTTTLNTSGQNVYQYSSVTIGGTGALTTGANLLGKAVYILVQGDLTVTSTATPAAINLKGQGGQGGAGGTAAVLSNFRITQTASVPGTAGTTGGGGGGGSGINNDGSTGSPGVSGGAGGAGGSKEVYDALYAVSKLVSLCPMGQGGSGGGSAQAAGGAGGAGGGCIIFLVGGNINLSSTLIATGVDGTAGSNGIPEYGAGGGGGGGGGFIGIFYAGSETANTATFTVSAGSAGGGGTGTTNNGGAGGAGGAGQYTTRAIKVVNIPF